MEWIDKTWELLAQEVVQFGLRWLVVGSLAVLGILLFGRGYKRRIAALEAKADQPTVIQNFHGTVGQVVRVENDSLYQVTIEGKGEVVSPSPITILAGKASTGMPTATGGLSVTGGDVKSKL